MLMMGRLERKSLGCPSQIYSSVSPVRPLHSTPLARTCLPIKRSRGAPPLHWRALHSHKCKATICYHKSRCNCLEDHEEATRNGPLHGRPGERAHRSPRGGEVDFSHFSGVSANSVGAFAFKCMRHARAADEGRRVAADTRRGSGTDGLQMRAWNELARIESLEIDCTLSTSALHRLAA